MKLARRLARLVARQDPAGPAPGRPSSTPSGLARTEPAVLGNAAVALEIEGAPTESPADPRDRVRRARIAHLRRLITDFQVRAEARGRDAPPAPSLVARPLPGERRDTPFGPIRVAEHFLEPSHCHGRVPVQDVLRICPEAVARLALDAGMAEVDLSGALFIDTETTGLAGGTGTLPFLLGLSRFEDGALVLEQLFLEAPGEEAPMLERLRDAVERCTAIVSYNGKSYDWPLLSTRYVLNRVAPPPPRPHLDLLHIARRLFRMRLGSARLVTMEEQILDMRRERDIDGAEIPGVYWSFLRHRDATEVARVMEHNANDLVALPALLAVMGARYAKLHAHDDPRDHLCLARVAIRAGDGDKAALFARAASEGGGAPDISVQAGLLLAEVLRRRGDVPGAVGALEDAIEAAEGDATLAGPAHLGLAKLHEHKTKDLPRALSHAAHTAPIEGAEDHARRVARLERRIRRRVEEADKKRRGRRRARARAATGPVEASAGASVAAPLEPEA